MFIREDISKPENRINLALFSLFQQDWFREWLLQKLELSNDAVVFPDVGRGGLRPDFRVVRGNDTLARIEVELGKDERQVENYSANFSEPMKTIWGRRRDQGNLSLEEICEYLARQSGLSPQVTKNVEHLTKLIHDGLGGFSRPTGRAVLSDEMWNQPFVLALRQRLGQKLHRTTRKIPFGFLGVDTTNSPNSQGFSLRVNSTESSIGNLSLMSIRSGGTNVAFPSFAKLAKYLPDHHVEVNDYSYVLADLGFDNRRYGLSELGSLPLSTVLRGIDDLARCVLALAGPPTEDDAIIYRSRGIGDWTIPTVGFAPLSRRPLSVQVNGEVINSITNSKTAKAKQLCWKRRLTHEVKSIRGDDPWKTGDDYAISLALRFHPGHHGGRKLDVDNFTKPIFDAVAAGLFCDAQTDPFTMERWDFDDSNFNTLLIHRLPDTSDPEAEGIAVYVSVR